ncbi:patulin cluster transcription factor patL [Physcia stellaris]|nr:patulin cluster transcription factor patL [Physcia stellaris]
MPPSSASSSPDTPQLQLPTVPPPRARQRKRGQVVARACDWCRVHRIKCDSHNPCSNCTNRGGRCSNSGSMKVATLPHAYREIERLKQRVEELEQEKEKEREAAKRGHQGQRLSLPRTLSDGQESGTSEQDLAKSRLKRAWEGIYISTARSPQKTWYGSSSLFYFIGRIDAFLTDALQQSHLADRMLPDSASTLVDGPTTINAEDQTGQLADPTDDPINTGEYLTSTQEEYFLSLFWQSYYTSYPIIDELEFKKYYRSLWATSDGKRKPSALADIVIALCVQYGMARLPSVEQGLNATSRANLSDTDATIAGRWYYRRCQTLLSAELESPIISTLQCHIFCSIYLCCASFQNMADSACGLAVRTAYMLGLHLEPPQSLLRRERETRKRLWWTLYVLETKMSMKLGRPFLLHDSNTTCSLPADDREIAMLVGSSFAPLGENVTWLTWNLHNTKLLLAARTAYTAIYEEAPDTLDLCNSQPITERLENWLKDLPTAIKTQRQNNGVPFSTDQSALEIEQFAPLWLQRQRLLLELLYHNLCINLYRPFISFTSAIAQTYLTDRTAVKCAAHAMALTHMMYQVLTSTSILAGWLEAFQWQWNAAITLVGFVLAYPHDDSSGAARKTIDISVAVLENFGNSFAVAARAANIMGELCAKVDVLTEKSQRKEGVRVETMQPATDYEEVDEETLMNGNVPALSFMDESLGFFNLAAPDLRGVLAQSRDFIATDMYNDFDLSGINVGYPD